MTEKTRVMTGEELRATRKALNLTQEDMAEAMGCHRRHLQQMEHGERPITPERARAVEMLLRGEPVPPYLRGGSDRGRRRQTVAEGEVRPMTRVEKIAIGGMFAAIAAGILWVIKTCGGAAETAAS